MSGSRWVGAVAFVAVALAACSGDSKPSATSTPETASSSVSSLPPLPSSSGSPTSSGVRCDGAPAPASAVNVTHAAGDFNGDGVNDSLTVYGTGTDSQPSPYHVQIELGDSRGTVDGVVADAATDNNQVVKALGGADITAGAGAPSDGSGAEVFVQVGSGASDSLVGVFQLIGCALTRLTGPIGTEPSQFAIGGSVTHLDGLRCDGTAGGQRLVQLSATSPDGVTYTTKETRLDVQPGGHFTPSADIAGSLPANDARLQAFSTMACVGVTPL